MVTIDSVELNEDKTEAVIVFSYATERGVARVRVNDDGMVFGVNEALTVDRIERTPNEVPIDVAEVSTTGDCPVTVTDSCSVATCNFALTVAVKPRLTRMPSLRTVENPASSNSTT